MIHVYYNALHWNPMQKSRNHKPLIKVHIRSCRLPVYTELSQSLFALSHSKICFWLVISRPMQSAIRIYVSFIVIHLLSCGQRTAAYVRGSRISGGVVLAWKMGQLWPWWCSNFALAQEILFALDLICVCVHWCWLIPSYLLFPFYSTLIYL